MSFVVALTGGIASGKTTVAQRLAALGADVIDADVIARELVSRGQPALEEIIAAFGHSVIDASGALDRRAMRERVFADADARRRLESILHPRLRIALRERANATIGPYALLVIPLLMESGGDYAWVNRVAVVDVAPATQRARLLARDAITPQLADDMLAAQATREARLARADDIIDNDATLAKLDARIAELHSLWLEMADASTQTG